MTKTAKKDKRTKLEKEIARLEEKMSKIDDQTSDDYVKCQEMLAKLYETDCAIKQLKNEGKRKLDPNTIITVVGGVAEIVLIMNHERLYVIATKAMSRVIRARL